MNLNPKSLLKYLDSRFLLLAYSYGMMGVSVAVFGYFGMFKDGVSTWNILKGLGIAVSIMLAAALPLAYYMLKDTGAIDMARVMTSNKDVTEAIARDNLKSFKNFLKYKLLRKKKEVQEDGSIKCA